jgi:hypothetical protein
MTIYSNLKETYKGYDIVIVDQYTYLYIAGTRQGAWTILTESTAKKTFTVAKRWIREQGK